MLTPEQIEAKLDRILLKAQKPGRYVGGELNSIRKNWDKAQTKVALVFPDIYDIGVSNVGLKILYDQINQREDALAERAYAPWLDMEDLMRAHEIPLYALESKQPLARFDLVGFTLPYETLYTNALNILDLAGLPLRSAERDESHPIIIAGGHSTMNPEPMHAFMDAFVIGEGEEAFHDIINVLQKFKALNVKRSAFNRNDLLLELAQIPGVYVPQFYETTYLEDGTVEKIMPTRSDIPKVVTKRIVAKLPPPPTKFIVPNIEVVHNRASVEIMRGCTRGCRFCQAGMITRPVRERSVEEVVEAADAAIRATGFEELALTSLSSSDYTHIQELVDAVSKRFEGRKLTVALPSLRIESVSIDLMDRLRQQHSAGFTLAPEAASERMRRIINKFIPDEEIVNTARQIYERGWTTLKLYFMIGHPSETLEDVQAIVDLSKRIIAEGRKAVGWKVKLNVGVSAFVPKPQTPFQWASCDTKENILEKQALLKRQLLKDKNIKVSWTKPEDTLLEAWLTRGDRRMAEVVYSAWENGAKFDAWNEGKKDAAWLPAFAEHGLDPAFYTHRTRRADEVFPWEHITAAVRKSFLFEDFRQSLEGQIRVDCRAHCFACGILPTFKEMRREHPGDAWKCPEAKKKPAPLTEAEGEVVSRQREGGAKIHQNGKQAMRARITFTKQGALRYTGHLDLHQLWERAMRRAGLPLSYSQGFHPQPKISLAAALPLGFSSRCETLDARFNEDLPVEEIAVRLQASLPPDIQILCVESVDEKLPALQTKVVSAAYQVQLTEAVDRSELRRRVEEVLQAKSIQRERRGKFYDLRPLIEELEVAGEDKPFLHMKLAAREGATGRPEEALNALGVAPETARVERTELIFLR